VGSGAGTRILNFLAAKSITATLDTARPSASAPPLLYENGHIRSLDGLRGLAILLVLVSHFLPEGLFERDLPRLGPVITRLSLAGVLGVQLFFVLSAFLITGILLNTKGHPGYFRNFYARRLLRIFPLYYGSLAIVFWVLPKVFPLDNAADALICQQWWLWTYLTNLPGHPPWDDSSVFMLGHFWSLAVEEHFYLLWPFLIWLTGRRGLCAVAAGLCCCATALRGIAIPMNSSLLWLAQWTTITSVDGLAIGALAAVAVRNRDWHARLIVIARCGARFFGLLMLTVIVNPLHAPDDIMQLIQDSVAAWFFVCLLILALRTAPAAWFAKTLSGATLVILGTYSYGLYVIHGILRPAFAHLFPAETFVQFFGSSLVGLSCRLIAIISCCLFLSLVSWQVIEKPFLSLKKYFTEQQPERAGL